MSLTIAYIHGTAPDKWFRRFAEQTNHQIDRVFGCDDSIEALFAGEADIALVRLPDPRITDQYHVVRLYQEQPGIGVPKDSELTLLEEISYEDIVGENCLYQPDKTVDVAKVREAVQVVAANVGVVLAPQPLLRSMNHKMIAHRPYQSGVPTEIGVVWPKEKDRDEIQDFVGITRGRTPRSSRQSAPKRSAREKAKAKQQRRNGKGGVSRRR
ncbi:LysR family transcriptional regulator substrate-binding protein [Corynebacterium freiburgense]|uniref:LysR family transcriptional regulator substrate-binding protein n=1 Tax=Corynebacterium freiburgense TaxID=556548 RepID=UPI00040A550F|nr:LysR family transcriptional regulator substrate-binding protein [Corynebacterium freiburgense]WJZ02195.1 LysR substrate binding domain protein [Corynebacterium freiburgense]